MLVLTRKQLEKIQIGDGVTITILKVKGNSVRIGIEAPADVKVVRSELKPESARSDESDEAKPAVGNLSAEQLEKASATQKATESQASGSDYRVISFRTKNSSTGDKPNNSPRAKSMREFLAARASNVVG